MAKGFKHGSGGVGLNFKVICNPQPANPRENTIWIDTDRINNYYFSATQPENMVEYDVWIITGISSTIAFNALKKNGIQVYPISAKQYIGGAWVDQTAKTHQGGEWVDWWNGELYRKGNEYTQITGGWEPAEFRFGEDYPYGEVTVTKTSTDMTIANTTTADRSGSISHKNALNLTGYTTLYVNVTEVSVYRGEYIAIIPEGELFLRNKQPLSKGIHHWTAKVRF